MMIPTRLPGRWIWLFLVLALMAMVLLRVLGTNAGLKAWLGSNFFIHVGWASSAGIALVVAMIVLLLRADHDTWSHRALDSAFLWLVLSWVLSTIGVALMALFDSASWTVLIRHLAYQVAVAATLNFLRNCMSRSTVVLRGLVLLQLGLGAVFLVWGSLHPQDADWAVDMWRITNVLGFTAVFLAMSHSLFSGSHYPPWLTLGACLMGFGLGLNDMVTVDGSAIPVTPIHSVFSIYLLMLWLLLSNRVGRFSSGGFEGDAPSPNSILGGQFAQSNFFDHGSEQDWVNRSTQLSNMRHRIAQDLHDGVGSQLVNLIASLDPSVPQQRELAQGLEECLLDVKMLGDGIDEDKESVLDALGRLRYRVQHSLDRLGIGLVWDIHASSALETLTDERVRHVVRIVQEALANVMRHSRAKMVEVSCQFVPEAEALMVSVTDDGIGMESNRSLKRAGKGLQGMRRRAESIHGVLEISSEAGRGTMVRLMMPVGAGPDPRLSEPSHGHS